jgi:hypothetical protein
MKIFKNINYITYIIISEIEIKEFNNYLFFYYTGNDWTIDFEKCKNYKTLENTQKILKKLKNQYPKQNLKILKNESKNIISYI